MKIEVKDHDSLRSWLKKFPGAANKSTVKLLRKKGNQLRNDVIQAMQNTNRLIGTAYKRTKSNNVHHPSAPGFPPAVDSGNYVKSIMMSRLRGGSLVWVSGVPYLKNLEEGTKKMAARPVWENKVNGLNLEKGLAVTMETLFRKDFV